MDRRLHLDRLAAPRTRRTYREAIDRLPGGVFLLLDGNPWLLWDVRLLHWTPGGYDRQMMRPTGGAVEVLTPRATVVTIAAGYVPAVHPSAR